MEIVVPFTVGFLVGLAAGRWFALLAPLGFAVWVTLAVGEGGDDIPAGWFLGLVVGAIGSVGTAAGVMVRRAGPRRELDGRGLRDQAPGPSPAPRLSTAEAISAAAALFLLASAFLSWFEQRPTCTLAQAAELTPAEAFDRGLGVLILTAALVPVGHAALRLTAHRALPPIALPLAATIALVLLIGGALTTLGADTVMCVGAPGGATARAIDTTPRSALWVGLALAVANLIAARVAAQQTGRPPAGG